MMLSGQQRGEIAHLYRNKWLETFPRLTFDRDFGAKYFQPHKTFVEAQSSKDARDPDRGKTLVSGCSYCFVSQHCQSSFRFLLHPLMVLQSIQ